MTHRLPVGIGSALILGLCLGVTGCAPAPAAAPATAPISVMVSNPVERDVTDYADFTARIAAVHSVDVRVAGRRLPGQAHFKEGALVKAGRSPLRARSPAVSGGAGPGQGQGPPG